MKFRRTPFLENNPGRLLLDDNLTKTFNNITDDLKKEITVQIQNEDSKRCLETESENKMPKKQVAELSKLSIEHHSKNEELEQYGRRLCLRVDGIPAVSNESSDDVMNLTKSLFKQANVSVPENVLDRAHRIGPVYNDRVSQKKCKSIIVRFTTSRHRTLFYRARKNIKSAEVKLDSTKSRFDLLKRANNHVKEICAINFFYTDVNCRLRVKFHDEKQEDIFSRRLKSCTISLIVKFKYALFYLSIILILQN